MDPRIRIRAALRCDGIGRLDCAEDAESGNRLAVRWLPLEANGDAAVRACARLPEHPRLPRIRHTGTVGASAFVAMDFPEGTLLSTRLDERLEVDEVIRMGAQLSDALATVHAQGVVHGEMSCDSVLMVAPNHAYLWDMPLVIANRLTDRRGENRLMQNLVKTAPFLAPERARGEGGSQASDVYALGAVLCVAAGAPLPQGATTLAVVHQVAQGQWAPRVPMVLPDPWRSTLARMVSMDPSARPSAAEVANIFAELPAAAALPTVPEFPVVKLPPELLAAADALLRRPSSATASVPAEPRRQSPPNDASTAETVKRLAVPRTDESTASTVKVSSSGPNSARPVLEALSAPRASAPSARGLPAVPAQSAPMVEPTPAAPMSAAPVSPSEVVTAKISTSGPTLARSVSEALTAPAPAPAPAAPVEGPAVQLTDTISVSQELADAGAQTLSFEEVSALHRSRRQVLLVAAGFGAAILGLAAVALVLASSNSKTVPAPAPVVQPTGPAVKAEAPVQAVKTRSPEEDLEPLPQLQQEAPRPVLPRTRAVRTAPAAAATPVKESPPPAEETAAATVEAKDTADTQVVKPAPTAPADFDFLDTTAEAPKAELKRPSW